VTDTDVNSQIAKLRRSKADTFMLFALPQQAIQSFVYAYKLGWHPRIYVSAVSIEPTVMGIARLGTTDMDDSGVLEILGENIEHPLPHIFVDRIEDFVDEHPARCVNQEAGEHEALLLFVAQFAVPMARQIELRGVGYPGSTYTLTYLPAGDRLTGVYYQAAIQQKFDLIFQRAR
jgi:hypothetical protein